MIRQILVLVACYTLTTLSPSAGALPVTAGASHDNLPSAQSIDGFFDLSFNDQIQNELGEDISTVIPHVEIFFSGLDSAVNWFSFSVAENGALAYFDIDCGQQGFGLVNTGCVEKTDRYDSLVELYTSNGDFLVLDDDNDSSLNFPDAGSEYAFVDSYLFTRLDAGTYAIRVSNLFPSSVPTQSSYTLNVSIGQLPAAISAPGSILLVFISLLCMARPLLCPRDGKSYGVVVTRDPKNSY